MIPQKDSDALIEAIEKFIHLSEDEKRSMGVEGRRKVEQQFDRNIVVTKYMDEIKGV